MRFAALALMLTLGCAHDQRPDINPQLACQNRPAWPVGCALERICEERGVCL